MFRYAVLTLLLLAAVPAAAQLDPSGQQERMRVEGQVEKKYTIRLDAPQGTAYCHAQIRTEYIQKNTIAAVKGEIENGDCGPSGGEYTISIRYRDEAGEIHNTEHLESWRREDDQNVRFEEEYLIGENVDLMRVRARKIVCICAEPDDSGEAESGEDQ